MDLINIEFVTKLTSQVFMIIVYHMINHHTYLALRFLYTS